ncbi:MAG: LLM class flavin-dependent oxidoreductase, partial [Actinomycetota bacterium]
EALAYCQAALADPPVGFEGEHYSLEAFPIAPRPVGTVKLLVGGSGAVKTPRLAGTYADEFNVYMGEDLDKRIARAREAAAAAGRDPDALVFSSASQVIGAPDRKELAARIEELAVETGFTTDEYRERLARSHIPVGTYDELRERFAGLASLGITRYYLQGRFDEDLATEFLEAIGG